MAMTGSEQTKRLVWALAAYSLHADTDTDMQMQTCRHAGMHSSAESEEGGL